MQPLRGKVAVVAGATRGAGRGIATALGAAGAIVYCSGRSTRAAGATPGSARDHRRDGRDRDTRGRAGHRPPHGSHRRGRGRGPVRARPCGARPARHPRQRRLGRRRAHGVRQAVLGARYAQGFHDARSRRPGSHHHESPWRAADDRAQRGIDRRDHRRRQDRLPRKPLLRSREDDRDPARVCHGARPRRPQRSRRSR